MPAVVICFLDGEVLHAETPPITFELAVLEAELRTVDSNSERALISVSAVRQIIVGDAEPAPAAEVVDSWDRAAFHFLDGEVLRASISPDARLGRLGGVWQLVEADSNELRTLAIPYAALKAVFQVRRWDARARAGRDDGARLDQLARILVEREAGADAASPSPERPLLSRMRRSARE